MKQDNKVCKYCDKGNVSEHFICVNCGTGMCQECYDNMLEHINHIFDFSEIDESKEYLNFLYRKLDTYGDYMCYDCIAKLKKEYEAGKAKDEEMKSSLNNLILMFDEEPKIKNMEEMDMRKRDKKGRFMENSKKFNIRKEERAYDIEGVAIIKVRAERYGQTPPWEGDHIMVKFTVLVPVKALENELHFDSKARLCSNSLRPEWGRFHEDSGVRYRVKFYTIKSDRWGKAFKMGYDLIEYEIEKIREVVEDRKQALEDAEKIDY